MNKKYLLDTHTLIWAAVGAENYRLREQVRVVLEDPESELFVSAVSLYEIGNKNRLGKLPEYSEIAENLFDVLDGLDVKELPLSWNHAELAAGINWSHGDPFDRMLAAQTQIEEMTLITCDKAFDDAPGVSTLW